jgi:mycofactocin system glycosyltransferase
VTALPEGFGLVLDRSVRTFRHGTVLVGGHPGRILTLTAEGVDGLAALLAGRSPSVAARQLGRRLVDAGMAHPRSTTGPVGPGAGGRVTVVVPARDRIASLDRCLSSLGDGVPVVVVDDCSDHPSAMDEVCQRHGARLIRRTTVGGPAAARNEALSAVDTELVAFVDSDCTVTKGWLAGLVWLFEDECIGAVAPRVRPERSEPGDENRALTRYTNDRSALDMGPEAGEVGPDRLVRYVPTAALVVRRSVLGSGFDPHLTVGEDVDLIWRLADRGWHVRYEPSVTVHHREPVTWRGLLVRRHRYGTSAAPLSRRHPGRLAPVELRPWPTVVTAALWCGRPRTALALVVAGATVLAGHVRGQGIPGRLAVRWSAQGAGWTWVGVGRAATVLGGPAMLVTLFRGRHRTAAAALLLAPPVVEWWRRRPALDPVRWSLASIADDMAYGAGVWTGCLRSRSFGPLVPAVRVGQGRGAGSTADAGDHSDGGTMDGGASASSRAELTSR